MNKIKSDIKNGFRGGKNLLFRKQSSILSAALIISLTYLASYILGFVKQRILISIFGVSVFAPQEESVLGTFFLADRIPSFIFNVLIAGSLSTVFIPIFTQKLKNQGKREAWKLCSNVLNTTIIFFSVISIIVVIFTPQIAKILTLNQPLAPLNDLVSLIRIMMLSQFILIFSSFITSSLQSYKRFLIPSLAPVMYNAGIIIFVLIFYKQLGIKSAAWGMVFGALLHLLIQLPLLKSLGFSYFKFVSFKDKNLKSIFSLAFPRIIGTTGDQLALLVDNTLAYFISPPMAAILALASSLQRLPVSVFGASIAQASLPTFSFFSNNELERFKQTLISSVSQMILLIFPASIVLLVLRIPLVRLVFGTARFSWDATIATSYTLAFFSISIFSQGLCYVLSRAFYALNDTKTPVALSLFSVAISSTLSVIFVIIFNLGVWSLSLSYSIGVTINLALLIVTLKKRVPGFLTENLLYKLGKIFWAGFILGVALYIPLKFFDNYLFDTTKTINLFILTIVVGTIGITTYNFICKKMKIEEREVLSSYLKKRLKRLKI